MGICRLPHQQHHDQFPAIHPSSPILTQFLDYRPWTGDSRPWTLIFIGPPCSCSQPKPHWGVITTACPAASASASTPSLISAVPAGVTLSTATLVSLTVFTFPQSTGRFHVRPKVDPAKRLNAEDTSVRFRSGVRVAGRVFCFPSGLVLISYGTMDLQIALERRARVEEFRRKHRIGLLALLFSDIVGSTQLKQRWGEDHMTVSFDGETVWTGDPTKDEDLRKFVSVS